MTRILIDLSTLRKNPRAGETHTTIPGLIERRRTVTSRKGGVLTVEEQMQVGEKWEVLHRRQEFPSKGPDVAEQIQRDDRQQFEDVFHQPLPAWLYSYEFTLVTCRACGATFPHTELDSDGCTTEDGDYVPIENICPKCGEADCCDIEYETVAAALLRQKTG